MLKVLQQPHMLCSSCYAMLCYAMLCYAMLCYAMLCYAVPSALRAAYSCCLPVCRYEAYELERVQLREALMKHKAEVDTLTQEHQEEVNALRTAQEAQQAAAQRQVAELQQQLQDREQRLAEAQVGASAMSTAGNLFAKSTLASK